jgi:hypothetical protein
MANSTLVLTDIQSSALSVSFEDQPGNVVSLPVGTVPVWAVTDTTVLTLTASADGMSASIAAIGKLTPADGSAPVTVSLTATLADGTVVAGALDVNVITSEATHAVITPGTPTVTPVAPVVPVTP